ncbi:hypothetical protein TanjilG_25137 [Lupinus angustifolius]|uniref:DUF4408 domain-containing protein n=2 Tax=Lupinus angustifolius TaxID=3871 RepID=A0A1J7GE96_LUPAN|nr:hypothetical protein TanjilG_25137 [Lupinus angustifolius]
MSRFNVFTSITNTLRILELFIALLLFSWFLTHLPLSAHYLHKLSSFIGNPLFIFAISNAIIAALVAQSGQLTTADDDGDTNNTSHSSLSRVAEELHQRKTVTNTHESETSTVTVTDCCVVTESNSDLRKFYRRSQSETSTENDEEGKKPARRKLRRSVTEKVRYPEDKLSNEEFQRTIEAFIAKQMRFLKEESMDIFLHEQTNS